MFCIECGTKLDIGQKFCKNCGSPINFSTEKKEPVKTINTTKEAKNTAIKSGKKISILGFAFKANTNDTRESAAITICKDLLEEGAILSIYDPKVDKSQIEKDLGIKSSAISENYLTEKSFNHKGVWNYAENIDESLNGSDASIILTEWEEYENIDWHKAKKIMRSPSWIFDARSILVTKKVKNAGLNLWRIGDGSQQ